MKASFARTWHGALAGMALAFTPLLALADSIDPVFYSDTLNVGQSVTINKTVTVTAEPPTSAVLDVMFLMDTTGSMGGVISTAKSAASGILTNLAGFGDLASGTAYFNDDPAPVSQYTQITSALSTNTANTQAGINGFTAGDPSYGGDFPEEGFYGIEQTVQNTSWRAGSNRFVVMFGDANDGFHASQAAAAAALAGSNVTLIGLSYSSSFTNQYSPTAVASGGQVASGFLDANSMTNLITSLVSASFDNYSTVCLDAGGAPAGVSVSTSGCQVGVFDRSIERTFNFDVTFTGDAAGSYNFPIHATVDGGIVATETDDITVVASVPEPGMLGLLGLGLLGMGLRRRRFQAA